jgi:hypothetical protein
VVLLKIKEEKSYKEIGEMLGKSEDEVRSIFSKALKKLKEIMTSLKGNEKKFAALVLEMTPYSAITKETMIKHRKSKRDNSLNSFNN